MGTMARTAWTRGRAWAEPVVSYVGYSLKEPWGEPRVVIGIDLLNAPSAAGRGRPSPDQPRDIAAELAGWNQGELPSQRPEQFASWPPGMPTAADQPPASS
jgi:hypothetical protein